MQFQPSEKFLRSVVNLQVSDDFKNILLELQNYQLRMGTRFHLYQGDELVKLQGRSALAIDLLRTMNPEYAAKELANLALKAKEAGQKPVY
jgi:hypothetical protein